MKACVAIALVLLLLVCAGCKPPNLLPPGESARAPTESIASHSPA